MAFQNIFILGSTGNVGKELVKQVQEHDMNSNGHLNPTRIIGIADSKKYTLNSHGIGGRDNDKWIAPVNGEGEWVKMQGLETPYTNHEEILTAIKESGLEGEVIFIDVTAEGPKMLEFHQKIIQDTINRIVTANKKPLCGSMEAFKLLASNPSRYRYNTTVMAGGGAVPYFQEIHGLSERVESVEGTFSGTLAYVCSELEKGGKTFSQIVKEARDKGYTEPHPIDDLNGEDVKRKLIILLRSSGIHIEGEDVELHGLVNPEEYSSMTPEEFLEAIKREDERIKNEVQAARTQGLVPRYIASYKEINGKMKAKVGLEFIPSESEIGSLKGTANKVLVFTNQRTPLSGDTPHVIQSPGAGIPKTAASVRADLLYLLNGTNLWQHN